MLQIPQEANPVFEAGIETNGTVHLESLRWSGEPDFQVERPAHRGTMWRRAWVNGVDEFLSWSEAFRLVQNEGRGLLIQGSREWQNIMISADVQPHLVTSAGIATRVQGMRRYYAFLLHRDGEARLVKVLGDETVLARCPFDWTFGAQYELSISAEDDKLTCSVDGNVILQAEDAEFSGGGVALVVEDGRTKTDRITIKPSHT